MVAGMARSGCQISMSWTQVNSLLSGFGISPCVYWHFIRETFYFVSNSVIVFLWECLFKQCHLSGRSWQLQEHCLHLDVAIQLPWLRNDCLSMVEEVMQHCLSLFDNWVSLFNSYKLLLTDWKVLNFDRWWRTNHGGFMGSEGSYRGRLSINSFQHL